MFLLKNKKNHFQLHTIIWRSGIGKFEKLHNYCRPANSLKLHVPSLEKRIVLILILTIKHQSINLFLLNGIFHFTVELQRLEL